jgi:hypothetical protein
MGKMPTYNTTIPPTPHLQLPQDQLFTKLTFMLDKDSRQRSKDLIHEDDNFSITKQDAIIRN